MEQKLENGFYWIKFLGEKQVAEYLNGFFLLTGDENCYEVNEMEEINEI